MKSFIKRNLFAFIMNIVNILMLLQYLWRNTLTLSFIPLFIDVLCLYATRGVIKESDDDRKQYIVSYILFLLATAGAGLLFLLWLFIFVVKIINEFQGR